MIKAIVVDDEKLVRKGFISMLDWSSRGIEIVGEAADGKAALELLKTGDVNLLFTDLTMPGMSGFDLIQQVNGLPRRIWTVVLTCHHEFDYVHEALRLGAIDYLVKTLLDLENTDAIIDRIVQRIHREEHYHMQGQLEAHPKSYMEQSTLFFCSLEDQPPGSELLQQPFLRLHRMTEIAPYLWSLSLNQSHSFDELEKAVARMELSRWQAVYLTGLEGQSIEQVSMLLERSLKNELFYRKKPGVAIMRMTLKGLEMKMEPVQPSAINACLSSWTQLKWALNKQEWERLLEETEALQPDYTAFHQVMQRMLMEWEEIFRWNEEALQLVAAIKRNRFWYEWRSWLAKFAVHVQLKSYELSVSPGVMTSLIRSIQYMRDELGSDLNQEDVAKEVNMSRSYFSQCFKKMVHEPFGNYLRSLRVKHAKKLLEDSDSNVYEIAASVGFSDDKYFSRVFREQTGLLPTEYRMSRKRNRFDEG